MHKRNVLLVDDEPAVRLALRLLLEQRGYQVSESDRCADAELAYRDRRPDAAIIDFRLPGCDGLELLRRLKTIDSSVPLILISGYGTIDVAVRAMKEGAEYFLAKPFQTPVLLSILEGSLLKSGATASGRPGRGTDSGLDPFLGTAPAVVKLRQAAVKATAYDIPILIQGETGTGKGVLARWIHAHSRRASHEFVDLNCACMPADLLHTELFGHVKGAFTGAVAGKLGLLELAHRGTVFLDEIGDMPIEIQAKLLKVLEEKHFRRLGDVQARYSDARVLAATNQDLGQLVQDKKFRHDLFFRLRVVSLWVPPLRERMQDLPLFAAFILQRISRELARDGIRLAPAAMDKLLAHAWPGNIRELSNVLHRAVVFAEGDVIGPEHISVQEVARTAPLASCSLPLIEVERRYIALVLKAAGGRVEEAGRRLGVPTSTLYAKLHRLRLKVDRNFFAA